MCVESRKLFRVSGLLRLGKNDFGAIQICLQPVGTPIEPSFLFVDWYDQIKIRVAYDVCYVHRVRENKSERLRTKDERPLDIVQFVSRDGFERKADHVFMIATVLSEAPDNVDSLAYIEQAVSKGEQVNPTALFCRPEEVGYGKQRSNRIQRRESHCGGRRLGRVDVMADVVQSSGQRSQ